MYYLLGSVAFLLFFLYDFNSFTRGSKLLNLCFMLGFICLTLSLAGLFISHWNFIWLDEIVGIISALLAVLCLFLLIYSLFFALPFGATYVNQSSRPKPCNRGMYALCRHPGVLWFFLFTLFGAFTLREPQLYFAVVFFNGLNLLYVVFQDRVTFMKNFDDYDAYKKNTPFLIPTFKSIKRAFHTMGRGKLNEI